METKKKQKRKASGTYWYGFRDLEIQVSTFMQIIEIVIEKIPTKKRIRIFRVRSTGAGCERGSIIEAKEGEENDESK